MQNSKTEKGFTLIELLVVMAIVSVLGAILVPVLKSFKDRGSELVGKLSTCCVQDALNAHFAEKLYFPSVLTHNELAAISKQYGCFLPRDDEIRSTTDPLLINYTCKNNFINPSGQLVVEECFPPDTTMFPGYLATFEIDALSGKEHTIASWRLCTHPQNPSDDQE